MAPCERPEGDRICRPVSTRLPVRYRRECAIGVSVLPPDRPVSNRILGWLSLLAVVFTAVYVAGSIYLESGL